MCELPIHQPEFEEVLSGYSDLARARNLFIALFNDKLPLINSGYTNRQIGYAIPVLKLIEESGEVVTYAKDPYLFFENSNEPDAEHTSIGRLPGRHGFYLHAHKDDTFRGWSYLTMDEKFYRIFFCHPTVIFDHFPGQVAFIALFDEEADITDLDFLVQELFSSDFSDFRLGLKRESKLTKIAKELKIAVTYKAAWVDEETKLEFAAKLDSSQDEPEYVAFRRLNPIFDAKGRLVPFGEKPNVSKDRVSQALSAQNRKFVSGQLSLRKAEI